LGDPFYTSMWDVWTVVVPVGTDVSHVRSNKMVQDHALGQNGQIKDWIVKSSGIRLNCPVVMVDGVQVPIEDAKTLLSSSTRIFKPSKFPFDIVPPTFTKSRTFQITEADPGAGSMTAAQIAAALAADIAVLHSTSTFPQVTPEVTGKGNVIPLILEDPLL